MSRSKPREECLVARVSAVRARRASAAGMHQSGNRPLAVQIPGTRSAVPRKSPISCCQRRLTRRLVIRDEVSSSFLSRDGR